MHLLFALLSIFIAWRYGDWKNWIKYHSTMLFFSLMELIYNVITSSYNYYLWKLVPDLYLSRVPTLALYVFIIFPASALVFLTYYPQGIKGQIIYITKWVVGFGIAEWLASVTGRIIYPHNWNLFSSIVFDFVMFLGLGFHHKRPLLAYILFILTTAFGIWAFHIPI
ncbi:MAG: CBO0543 family protein [Bacillota bacterium]|nr:CBO0543 family protein [Bacillota bacterium]